jgi:hypothetical protein
MPTWFLLYFLVSLFLFVSKYIYNNKIKIKIKNSSDFFLSFFFFLIKKWFGKIIFQGFLFVNIINLFKASKYSIGLLKAFYLPKLQLQLQMFYHNSSVWLYIYIYLPKVWVTVFVLVNLIILVCLEDRRIIIFSYWVSRIEN